MKKAEEENVICFLGDTLEVEIEEIDSCQLANANKQVGSFEIMNSGFLLQCQNPYHSYNTHNSLNRSNSHLNTKTNEHFHNILCFLFVLLRIWLNLRVVVNTCEYI